MKKNMMRLLPVFFTVFLLFSTGSFAVAQSAGGGISFFIPESLYLDGSGSISHEVGLSTEAGIGSMLSLPVGFTYIKASGLLPYESGEKADDRIWLAADTVIPYLRLKAKAPLGTVFIELYGGVAGGWFLSPEPFAVPIGRKAGEDAGVDYLVLEEAEASLSFGWGYQLGGSIGVTIGQISVSLDAGYSDLRSEATVTSDSYLEVTETGSVVTAKTGYKGVFDVRLRGFSAGIGGSFAF